MEILKKIILLILLPSVCFCGLKEYEINLDLPLTERYQKIMTDFNTSVVETMNYLNKDLGPMMQILE